MIKLHELLNEAKLVDGWVFVDQWKKALSILKSSGGWSPHLRRKAQSDPVGYTNSDFWGKVPDKYDDMNIFGYHEQAMDDAFIVGGDWKSSMFLIWMGDGKEIVKILKKAGFKVKWNGSEKKKIELVPTGPKPGEYKHD